MKSSICNIDETLTSTTTITLGQCGLESNGNKGVLHILQSFNIRYSLVSNPGHICACICIQGCVYVYMCVYV